MIEVGDTRVLCSASVEEKVPPFLKGSGSGWVTAEYSLLPRSTGTRNQREAAKGKLTGRTHEIQRLIEQALQLPCHGLRPSTYHALLGLLSGKKVTDSASGMRVFKREILERIYPLPDGLNLTPVMSTRALHEGVRVGEIPIPYSERVGRSKLSVVRDGRIFLDDVDRQDFVKTLAEACQKTGWQVHAYCLMPNHYHQVIETPEPNLVAGMAWLQSTYTIRLNHRHELFDDAFQAELETMYRDTGAGKPPQSGRVATRQRDGPGRDFSGAAFGGLSARRGGGASAARGRLGDAAFQRDQTVGDGEFGAGVCAGTIVGAVV